MLERTATSLEPCKLQRVLPSSKSTWKNHRRLRSSFWNHGASDIELFNACQHLLRTSSADLSQLPTSLPPQTKSEIKLGSMTASAFLLDFLYPQGVANLLRRITPGILERRERSARRFSRLGPGIHATIASSSRRQTRSTYPGDDTEAIEGSHYGPVEDYQEESDVFDSAVDDALDTAVASPSATRSPSPSAALLELLRHKKTTQWIDPVDKYNQIWELYIQLDDDVKAKFRTDVLHTLANSTRPIEAWRVSKLFPLYKLEEWTELLVRDVVTIGLKAGNAEEAISTFEKGLETKGFVKGFDPILAHALNTSNWDLVIQSWEAVSTLQGFSPPVPARCSADDDLTEISFAGVPGDTTPLLNTTSAYVSPAEDDSADGVGGNPSLSSSSTTLDPTNTSHVQSTLSTTSMPIGGPEKLMLGKTKANFSFSIKFHRLSEVEDLRKKILGLYSYVDSWEETDKARMVKAKLDSLLYLMSVNSLHQFQPADAQFLVHRSGNLLVSYPRLIKAFVQRHHDKLAIEFYRKYRQLPGSIPRKDLLGPLFGLVYPHDVQGIRLIRDDWRQLGDQGMPHSVYAKFITFYALRGDVNSLYEVWDRCPKLSNAAKPEGSVLTRQMIVDDVVAQGDPGLLAAFMQAHAKRGDTEEVNYLLAQALKKSQRSPTILEHNILLEAYVKDRDYEGALHVFTEICDHSKPDLQTFLAVMHLASQLGDLEFCLDLYRMTKEYKLRPTAKMVNNLIEAYCRNERYHDAEILCVRVTSRGDFSKSATTMMWNSLIRHHGLRRDLGAVNHLLNTMSKFKLPYDNETYNGLLIALINCRQSHHALHLLQMAKHKAIFEPTLHHYILLMTAFIRSGEPDMVLKVHDTLAKNQDLSDSADLMTRVISAYGKWTKMARNKFSDKSGQWFVGRALETFRKSLGRADRSGVDDPRSVTLQYSKMVSILAEARDFVSARDIVELYKNQFKKRAADEELPIHLLSSMMLADYYEHKFTRAKQTWDIIMRQITEGGRLARDVFERRPKTASGRHAEQRDAASAPQSALGSGEALFTTPSVASLAVSSAPQEADDQDLGPRRPVKLLPALRYYLNEPLKTMQRILVVEQDAYGLEALIKRVTDAGFEINSPNWNYYVQAQARMKCWEEAFKTCEQKLMPNWGGWARERMSRHAKRQLPLERRRLGQSDNYLRPISHTLMVLTKEYLDIEKISLWSPRAARLMKMITKECPLVVVAVTTLIRDPDSNLEDAIFRGTWDPESDDLSGVIKSRRPYYDDDMKRFYQSAPVEDDGWPVEIEVQADRVDESPVAEKTAHPRMD